MKFEPQCKKQSDLYREWARVLDMCEAAGFITPANCIKCSNVQWSADKYTPSFDAIPTYYEFALAIIEGKPVFRGDVLYSAYLKRPIAIIGRREDVRGRECLVVEGGDAFAVSDFNWNHPESATITVEFLREDAVRVLHCLTKYEVPVAIERAASAMKAVLEGKK